MYANYKSQTNQQYGTLKSSVRYSLILKSKYICLDDRYEIFWDFNLYIVSIHIRY